MGAARGKRIKVRHKLIKGSEAFEQMRAIGVYQPSPEGIGVTWRCDDEKVFAPDGVISLIDSDLDQCEPGANWYSLWIDVDDRDSRPLVALLRVYIAEGDKPRFFMVGLTIGAGYDG